MPCSVPPDALWGAGPKAQQIKTWRLRGDARENHPKRGRSSSHSSLHRVSWSRPIRNFPLFSRKFPRFRSRTISVDGGRHARRGLDWVCTKDPNGAMRFIATHLELFGACLVFIGIVASMFLGSPKSRVRTGTWSLGETDERQLAWHNRLTLVAPALSGVGAICYIIAAWQRYA